MKRVLFFKEIWFIRLFRALSKKFLMIMVRLGNACVAPLLIAIFQTLYLYLYAVTILISLNLRRIWAIYVFSGCID